MLRVPHLMQRLRPTGTVGALGLIVLVGSVVRLLLHRGVTYSPADEAVYARYSCYLTERGVLNGYPEIVSTYLSTPADHIYPSPARWGFLLPSAGVSEVLGCGPAAVAWVSTLSGIALLGLVAVLAHRVFRTVWRWWRLPLWPLRPCTSSWDVGPSGTSCSPSWSCWPGRSPGATPAAGVSARGLPRSWC